MVSGGQFLPIRSVMRKNEAGDTIRVEAPRHVRKGWQLGLDGNLYFQVRYGSKPLDLGKDVNAVVLQGVDEIPAVADVLISAIKGGELDDQLRLASEARRAVFGSRTKKASPSRS